MLYRKRRLRRKGHAAMYKETIERIKQDLPALYSLEELELTTLLTISAAEMIKDNIRHVTLNDLSKSVNSKRPIQVDQVLPIEQTDETNS